MKTKSLEELKEYRDMLIMQINDDEFIKKSPQAVYEKNVQNLMNCLLEIKGHYIKIKQFKGEYRWLSNFWESDIKYKDLVFPTNENFYQAMKTKNKALREEFTKMTPYEAKDKGKEIVNEGLLREDWEDIKL